MARPLPRTYWTGRSSESSFGVIAQYKCGIEVLAAAILYSERNEHHRNECVMESLFRSAGREAFVCYPGFGFEESEHHGDTSSYLEPTAESLLFYDYRYMYSKINDLVVPSS